MNSKNFGRKLREIRKSKGFTQEALAELAGIDEKHLSRLENGRYFPAYNTLNALVNVLGVNINDLIGIELDKIEVNENPLYTSILKILNSASSDAELCCYLDAVKCIQKTLKCKE